MMGRAGRIDPETIPELIKRCRNTPNPPASGEGLSTGIWYIRYEGKRQLSTGTRQRRQAEKALARFIAERHRPAGPSTPDEMTVARAGTVLRAPRPDRQGSRPDRSRRGGAVPLLGPLPLSSVNGASCRSYARKRKRAPATVRKELGTLAAAINYCHTEGYLTASVKVRLPPRHRRVTAG